MMSKATPLYKEIIINILLIILLLIPFINKINEHSLHGDEIGWLYSTKFFTLLFIEHDINNKQFKDVFSYDQPPVGRYIIGLALTISGYGDRIKELKDLRWDYSKSEAWNRLHGVMPQDDILYIGRLTMALFGAFTCFLIYWIGKKIFSRTTGIIASFLLVFTPEMLLWCPRIKTDAPLIFFLTANVALMIFFYHFLIEKKTKKTLPLAILIGINIFLSVGVKLNGSLAGLTFIAFCIYIILIKILRHKLSPTLSAASQKIDLEIKMIFGSILIALSTALFLFIISNPFLYENPIKGMVKMICYRMTAHHYILNSFWKKFHFVFNQVFFSENFAVLKVFLKIPLDFCLFISGIILIILDESKHIIKSGHPSLKSIVLLWTVVTFTGIITWIPLDWSMYCLPLIPCTAMIIGYTVGHLVNSVRHQFLKKNGV